MAAKVARKKAVEKIQKDAVLASVGGLTMSSVTDQIVKTQVEVQKKLADVGNEIAGALTTLENLNGAIVTKQAELKELHGIESAALNLAEIQERIDAAEADWDARKDAIRRADAEAETERQKMRAREQDDYNYRTNIERRKQGDEFAAQLAAAKKAEADRKEALERGWASREAELKARETELASLKAAVAAHPEELKKSVDREVAIVTNSLKRSHDLDTKLKDKDAETALKLSQQETMAGRTEIDRLKATITSLQAQVESAHKSAQDVATKALESASGRSAMDALQQSMNRSETGSASARGSR